MSKDLTDVVTTAQEQFFSALEGVQDAVLEGVKLWRGSVAAVVPDSLTKNVPLPKLEWLPTPAVAASLTFDLAEKLFAQQRRFAEQVLNQVDLAGKDSTPVVKSPLVTVPPKSAAAK